MVTIILLNGTSSAGKSSIAYKIQEFGDLPYLHVKMDTFLRMAAHDHIRRRETSNLIIKGFHNSLAGLSVAGNCLVIDHVFQEQEWFLNCLKALKDLRVYFIGVHCDLETLKQREINRGDRSIGTAEYQYERVHTKTTYDFEVDTANATAETCAQAILKYVTETAHPLAWEKLLAENNIE
jgi:chloramphenicol 3-O phosphotransferase